MHVSFPETIRNVHDEKIVHSPEIYSNSGNEALQQATTKIEPLLQAPRVVKIWESTFIIQVPYTDPLHPLYY